MTLFSLPRTAFLSDSSRTTTEIVFSGDEDILTSSSSGKAGITGRDLYEETVVDEKDVIELDEGRQFGLPLPLQAQQPLQIQLQAQLQQAQMQVRLHQAHILQIQTQLQYVRQKDQPKQDSGQDTDDQDREHQYPPRRAILDLSRRKLKESLQKPTYGSTAILQGLPTIFEKFQNDGTRKSRSNPASDDDGLKANHTTRTRSVENRPRALRINTGDMVTLTDDENTQDTSDVGDLLDDRTQTKLGGREQSNVPFLLSQSPMIYNLDTKESISPISILPRFIPEAPKLATKKPASAIGFHPNPGITTPKKPVTSPAPISQKNPISILFNAPEAPRGEAQEPSLYISKDPKTSESELTEFVGGSSLYDGDEVRGVFRARRTGGGLFGSPQLFSSSPQVYNLDSRMVMDTARNQTRTEEGDGCLYLGHDLGDSESGGDLYIFSGV